VENQTLAQYSQLVARYLADEWPAASLAIASSEAADRAAARASLACFLACASPLNAAGEVAHAVAMFVSVD
jgi:hypothetical protein